MKINNGISFLCAAEGTEVTSDTANAEPCCRSKIAKRTEANMTEAGARKWQTTNLSALASLLSTAFLSSQRGNGQCLRARAREPESQNALHRISAFLLVRTAELKYLGAAQAVGRFESVQKPWHNRKHSLYKHLNITFSFLVDYIKHSTDEMNFLHPASVTLELFPLYLSYHKQNRTVLLPTQTLSTLIRSLPTNKSSPLLKGSRAIGWMQVQEVTSYIDREITSGDHPAQSRVTCLGLCPVGVCFSLRRSCSVPYKSSFNTYVV